MNHDIKAELHRLISQLDEIRAGLSDLEARLEHSSQDEPMQQFETIPEPEPEPEAEIEAEPAIKLPLNDRYRFQRELFANSAQKMNAVMETIAAMSSRNEIAEYLVSELGWNPDTPEVAEFIAATTRRFDSHPPLLA